MPKMVNANSNQVGNIYELVNSYKTSTEYGDNAGKGSSSGSDTLIATIIKDDSKGIELIYDLPDRYFSKDEKKKHWQFPAHILRSKDGTFTLLNYEEIEQRVEDWLNDSGWSREACGQWIFTWNAFKIECDPQSILEKVEEYDLRVSNLKDGELYENKYALEPAKFKARTDNDGNKYYYTDLIIDPEIIRRKRAENNVIIAKISGEKTLLAEALLAEKDVEISGTMRVLYYVDGINQPYKRITITKERAKEPNGMTEIKVSTFTLEKKLISSQ